MSCQNKYTPACKNPNCNKAIEAHCERFLPFPPRMTNEDYAKKQTELFKDHNIPAELQGPMSHLAWEEGHAYGYEEVLSKLQDLVFELHEPIKNLIKRIHLEDHKELTLDGKV